MSPRPVYGPRPSLAGRFKSFCRYAKLHRKWRRVLVLAIWTARDGNGLICLKGPGSFLHLLLRPSLSRPAANLLIHVHILSLDPALALNNGLLNLHWTF